MNAMVTMILNLLGPLNGNKSYVGAGALFGAVAVYLFFPQYATIGNVLFLMASGLLPIGLAHKLDKLKVDLTAPDDAP